LFGLDPLPRSLEAALRDASSARLPVRLSAVRELGRHAAEGRGGEALSALLLAVTEDPSPDVRGAAALALADARAHTAIGPLVKASGDVSLNVRQMALLALGEVATADDARVTPLVEAGYEDDAAAIRFQSLIAASSLDLGSAEGALVRALSDVDPEVRHVAIRLLEERATSDDGGVHPSPSVLAAAARALNDASLRVRVAAAVLLGGAGSREGAAVIAEAIAETLARPGAIDREDEQAAIVLAGDLRLEAARGPLSRRLRRFFGKDRFLFDVRIALAQMQDPRAITEILRGLGARSRDERTLSAVAAGRAGLAAAKSALLSMRGNAARAEEAAVEDALAAIERSARAP
jgi:HEAT repeat protein